MSYAIVETGLKDVLIKAADPFNERTINQGHYREINTHPVSVVLTPSVIASRRRDGFSAVQNDWQTKVELFVRATKPRLEDIYDDIKLFRQQLIDIVDIYPTLDSTAGVTEALMVSAGEPTWELRGPNYFWTQILTLSCKERVILTGGEMAYAN